MEFEHEHSAKLNCSKTGNYQFGCHFSRGLRGLPLTRCVWLPKACLEKERKAAGSAFNAAKASFYMDHVCQLMRRRKKLLERKAAGENVEKQILVLENEIEGQIPLPKAEERFAERREKYDEHRIQMKMLKKQIRLVDQILKEVSSLPPVHELTRDQDQIREKEMIRSEKILERNEEKRRE